MTPEQALEIFNQIRLRVELNGKDHELARQAYETLKNLVLSAGNQSVSQPETKA